MCTLLGFSLNDSNIYVPYMISSPPGFVCICHVWSDPSNSLSIQVLCLFVSKSNIQSSCSSLPLSSILIQTSLHSNFGAITTVLICVIYNLYYNVYLLRAGGLQNHFSIWFDQFFRGMTGTADIACPKD